MKKIMYIIVISLAVIIITFVMLDGSFLPKKYNRIYSEKYLGSYDDLQKIVGYAMGAPSSHNMQPWLIKIIENDTIELYADMKKQLPVIDEENTQLLISQGTFIEKFNQGALIYGYSTVVEYADVDLSSQLPIIAVITIEKTKSTNIDTVSGSTTVVDKSKVAVDIEQTIGNVINSYDGFTYEYISDGVRLNNLQDILLQGTIAESRDIRATEELLDIFRWTEWEKNKHRYGLSLNSVPAIIKPFIQPIMTVSSKNIEAFGESSIKMFEDRLANDVGYILVKKGSPDDVDYIQAGQIYQNLIYEASGYSLRPAVQVLQEFVAMDELNREFQAEYGADAEVLLIISVQMRTEKKLASNPRHLLEDIIIE